MLPCPVCGKEMKRTTDYLDGYILLEEHETCPEEHYSYSFETGLTEIWVGDEVFSYIYSDDEKYKEDVIRQAERAAKILKEKLNANS